MNNPNAAILIIGNEILSGRTSDANTQFLCQRLSEIGICVRETRIVPDDESMIIETIQFLSRHYRYVFTTGGIGATHDDITAACLAKAFNVPLVRHPEAYQIISTYYGEKLNEARKRMALIPEGAQLILNSVSAAPGFQIHNVFALAGIPMVMHAMFETLYERLETGTPIVQKTITCPLPENNIADELTILQQQHPQVEIGSYPYFLANGSYGVSLVIRGTDPDLIANVKEELVRIVHRHGVNPTID